MKTVQAKHSLMGNDEFPIEELKEKLAIQFGKDAVALSGPCEGQPICECVTKQLKKDWDKNKKEYAKSDKNKLTKLATLLGESYMKRDDTEKAIQDIQKLGFDKTASSKIASYLKAFVLDDAADKDLDDIKDKADSDIESDSDTSENDTPEETDATDATDYTDHSEEDETSEETESDWDSVFSDDDMSKDTDDNTDETSFSEDDMNDDAPAITDVELDKPASSEFVTIEIPKDVANEIAHAIIDSEKKEDDMPMHDDTVSEMPDSDSGLEIEIIKDPEDTEIPGEPKDEQVDGEQFVTNEVTENSDVKSEDAEETKSDDADKPKEDTEVKEASVNKNIKTATDKTLDRAKDLASSTVPSIKTQGDSLIKAEKAPNFADIGKVSANPDVAPAPKVPASETVQTLGVVATVSASIEADSIIVTANGRKYRVKAAIASLPDASIAKIASNIERLPFNGNGKDFTLSAFKVFKEECESCKVKKTASDKKLECPKPLVDVTDPKIKAQSKDNPSGAETIKESDYSKPSTSTLGDEEKFTAETPTIPTAGGKDGGNVETTGTIIAKNEQNRQVLAEKDAIQTKLNEAQVKQERYKAASVYVADLLRHNEIAETEFTKEMEKIAGMPVPAIQALIVSTKKARERVAASNIRTTHASNELSIPLVTGIQSDRSMAERLANVFTITKGLSNSDAIPDNPASRK